MGQDSSNVASGLHQVRDSGARCLKGKVGYLDRSTPEALATCRNIQTRKATWWSKSRLYEA